MLVKAKAQALYYELRKLGLDHSQALARVVDFVLEFQADQARTPVTRIKKNV